MNCKKLPTIFLLTLISCLMAHQWAGADEKSAEVRNVSPDEAEALLKENPEIVVLDVRTQDEFEEGHIKDAVLIDYLGDDFEAAVRHLDPEKTYLLHCASGGRSSSALEDLESLGYHHIYHLEGGMKGWEGSGKAVER